MSELDANKSDLTHRITALASGYMSAIGCKPVETEVTVAAGWIADVASFFYPTMTELKHAKLLNKFLCTENFKHAHDRADYFGRQYGMMLTVLAEVKISKADFSADLERKFKTGAAHLNYLAYPNSLNEFVESKIDYQFLGRWGRLVCSDNGERILKIHAPRSVWPLHSGEIVDFVCQVAIRRDHRTSKVWLRDMLRSYRADRGKKICSNCRGKLS